MGSLYYGTQRFAVDLDDRPLAHVKVALLILLREGYGVAFSFTPSPSQGGGRETLWISPSTDIRFFFSGGRSPTINDEWVREIVETAHSPTGMRLIPEPSDLQTLSTATG